MLRKLCSASVAGSSPLLASISTHEAKPAKDSNEHRRLKPFRPRPTCQLQRLLVQRTRPQYRLYDPLRLASRDQPWTLRSCTISHRYCHRRQRKRLGGRYARAGTGGWAVGGYTLLRSHGDDGEDEEEEDAEGAAGSSGKRRWSMWSNLKNAKGSGQDRGRYCPLQQRQADPDASSTSWFVRLVTIG